MQFYLSEKEAVLNEVGSGERGLGSAEAEQRLLRDGKNRLKVYQLIDGDTSGSDTDYGTK